MKTFSQDWYNPKKFRFWILVALLCGVILRSIQYFGATSMWLDEVASAMNIQTRNFAQLATEKLDFNQVAPLGFLWTSKIAALVFGENDLAYRFVPFCWALLSLPLFYLVAKRFLSGAFLLAAVMLFSFSYAAFLYAEQAKQYSGDLAISLFFVLTAMKISEGHTSNRAKWIYAIAGFVGILSCFQSMPILLFLLSCLFFWFKTQRKPLPVKPLLIPGAAWFLAAVILTWYIIHMNEGVRSAMGNYWSNGYPPNAFGLDYLLWIPKTLYQELSFFIAWWFYDLLTGARWLSLLLLIFSIPGIVYMKKSTGIKTLFLFTPLVIALLLAVLKQYPFANRVSFYATFPVIIGGFAGLQALMHWRPKLLHLRIVGTIAIIFALIPVIYMSYEPMLRPPYYAQPMQPILKELKKQLQPGDIIYVYHKARFALKFYGPKEGITDYIVAKADTTVTPILRDADKLKGNKRVWFVFTQWTERQTFPDSIKAYLGHVIGREIGKIPDPYGGTEDMEAAAYLYDLSNR
ncbi:MAG TPA: hypothetical protein VHL77_10055 [Ferruginibacter sp.]|nr:hypothetical protein [Ferruginibacter sp.]